MTDSVHLPEGTMRCDSCGHENPPGASFCADCGTPLGAATRRTASKRGFRKALVWTAVPITALSITSTAGGTFLDGFELVWFVAVGVAVGLKVAGKSQIASGVPAGAGVGFMALAVTCFWQPLWL